MWLHWIYLIALAHGTFFSAVFGAWTYPNYIGAPRAEANLAHFMHIFPNFDSRLLTPGAPIQVKSERSSDSLSESEDDLPDMPEKANSKRAEGHSRLTGALEIGGHNLQTITDSKAFDCHPNDESIVKATCPTLDRKGRYRCISAGMLCDGKRQCPNGEDENDLMCMFYKLTVHYIGSYGQSLTKWILPTMNRL